LFIACLLALTLGLVSAQCGSASENSQMPPPFTRVLCYVPGAPLTGHDVIILQNLIIRCPAVNSSLSLSGTFDQATQTAVRAFQTANNLSVDGVFGPASANELLNLYSCDGYKDLGRPASYYGSQYLYKFHFQVFRNRSYETMGALYDANNVLQMNFRIRTHGFDNTTHPPWPHWSNTVGLNMFTSNGNTPTGLAEADLNSPEDDPASYGPFPVNRMINGLEGNAKFLLDHNNPIRSGILLHTGEWRTVSDWTRDEDMPNSEGCIHAHEESSLPCGKFSSSSA